MKKPNVLLGFADFACRQLHLLQLSGKPWPDNCNKCNRRPKHTKRIQKHAKKHTKRAHKKHRKSTQEVHQKRTKSIPKAHKKHTKNIQKHTEKAYKTVHKSIHLKNIMLF